MSALPLLASEVGPSDARRALFEATVDQIAGRFPKTVEHAGRTWWLSVHLGGPRGLALVALFDSPTTKNPAHSFVVQLGGEFGHVPPVGATS